MASNTKMQCLLVVCRHFRFDLYRLNGTKGASSLQPHFIPGMPIWLESLVKCADSVHFGYLVTILAHTYDMNRMTILDSLTIL